MTITIVPETDEATGATRFRAQSGTQEATGQTAGTALDALTSCLTKLDNDLSGTLVLVQRFDPDPYFTAAQQHRLADLMAKWRTARDTGVIFPDAEQKELESLVQAEIVGMTKRAKAFLHDASK